MRLIGGFRSLSATFVLVSFWDRGVMFLNLLLYHWLTAVGASEGTLTVFLGLPRQPMLSVCVTKLRDPVGAPG